MSTDHRERLRRIRRFDQLVMYLREELDWPIDSPYVAQQCVRQVVELNSGTVKEEGLDLTTREDAG